MKPVLFDYLELFLLFVLKEETSKKQQQIKAQTCRVMGAKLIPGDTIKVAIHTRLHVLIAGDQSRRF